MGVVVVMNVGGCGGRAKVRSGSRTLFSSLAVALTLVLLPAGVMGSSAVGGGWEAVGRDKALLI